MEAIAPQPLRREGARQGQGALHGGLLRMEGGVEAGHLRQLGVQILHMGDGRQVVRLVQRRQRAQLLQGRSRGVVHLHRLAVVRAAVHHPVPHGDHRATKGRVGFARCQPLHQPAQGLAGRRFAIVQAGLLVQGGPVGAAHVQAQLAGVPRHLAVQAGPQGGR
jgi:hypothetical protein